jgi:Mce-associated membrane protein
VSEDHDRDLQGPSGSTSAGPTLSPTVRTVLAAVLAVLVAVSATVIVVLLDRRGEVETALDARRDVVRVAERFTVQVNNYDSESVDDYKATVSSMLTTKFRDEFEKAMADIVKSVKDAQMDSEGTVLASGVASVDRDSAQVLVVADAEVKTIFDSRERHFRWEISLVRVDGDWLVDDFTPVS